MGIARIDGKMEGWLYLIRFSKLGLPYSRKRYFILEDNFLKSFKTKPISDKQEPVRSAIIDSYIRVADDGRESINRKVFFLFTLYNTSSHNDQLKLGATSPEEAARWIHSLQDAALKKCANPAKELVAFSSRKSTSLRLSGSKRAGSRNSIDWTFRSSVRVDTTSSDVISPSPWKIFGCQNGLRLFKEAKEWDSRGRLWDDHPAIMAVGVVDGTSEEIFRTLMSLGPSRSEWDFCFYRGSVVEHLDGHTDIVHELLHSDWLPWGMKRRDLLLRRYWRREEDGTYVILYHSVFHKMCHPHKGYVRACLKICMDLQMKTKELDIHSWVYFLSGLSIGDCEYGGGYVITPVNQGKMSLVKHMLAIDWKFWKLSIRPSSARTITIRMLEKLAALRELYKTKNGNESSELSCEELSRELGLPQNEMEDIKNVGQCPQEVRQLEGIDEVEGPASSHTSLKGLDDTGDVFFDVPEPSDYEQSDGDWSPEQTDLSMNMYPSKLSSAAVFVKKLQDLRVQKMGYMDLQDSAREESIPCSYGSTLQIDPNCDLHCSCSAADPSTFLIRGQNYLRDNQKVKAKETLMQLVGADWLQSNKREDDLGGRPGGIVQRYAERGGPEFFFIVNIQFPGTTQYNIALYYMMRTPLEENPIVNRFVNGDNAYRNSRFKLIPHISKGSWIVKQSVGKKACLLGQALEVRYFRGKNYLELAIDVGSSTVARGVANLVLGYLTNLIIEMAFLIQANTEEELPEILIGTCRLNHLDTSKSVLSTLF
ncbi:protein ENHANCED DISEASE RESISTANCE 2 isoform X1 [Ziziphus jujuba]|uniref:Protein ENHANCED DISEASE RESISTANCE 2 isoform X1 n=1 Tax=Ziziphus jujuba TaxID=326968 RepID=A0ABM4AH04_ZIZJJ|nr:protein ENHANCED DISEASE RESISTANCE 2 isoform X1 [Ziziphus jujuba]